MFIAIDGGDGTGKTTQLALLSESLKRSGETVLLCREPGSTALGEEVRQLLLHSDSMKMGARSELFLFMAARAQLLEEVVRPALAQGQIVLVDRFFLSTVVYQGYAAGLPVEDVWKVGQLALKNCYPDLTFLLDISPQIALSRIERPLDRMEAKGIEFHERVRQGFLQAFQEFGRYFSGKGYLIDASQSKDAIAWEIYQTIQHYQQYRHKNTEKSNKQLELKNE